MSRFGRNKPSDSEDPFDAIPDIDERLADWVDGTMSERDRSRFEAEIRVSPHVRDQVDDYEKTVATIREALGAKTHESNLADRVMSSIEQEAATVGPSVRSRWSLAWGVMSAAALLGIAVLINTWGGALQAPLSQATTAAQEQAESNLTASDESSNRIGRGSDFVQEMSSERTDRRVLPSAAVLVPAPNSAPAEVPRSLAVIEAEGAASEVLIDAAAAGQIQGGVSVKPDFTSPASKRPGSPMRYGGRSGRGVRPPGSPAIEAATKTPPPSDREPKVQSAPSVELGSAVVDVQLPGDFGVVSEEGADASALQYHYVFHLAAQDEDAEVLPLVTIDGFAVVADPSKSMSKRQRKDKAGDDSSTDTHLWFGTGADAKESSLAEFFESQMLPAAEWQQQSRRKRAALTAAGKELLDWQQLSFGRLQGFAVGASRFPKETVTADKSPSPDAAAENDKKAIRPGQRQAKSSGFSQRDWLVIGPQSEVAKLLASLREYADSVRSAWKSGEVRIVIRKPVDQDPADSRDTGSDSAAGRSTLPRPAGQGDAKQLTERQREAVKRVVLRFRVRR